LSLHRQTLSSIFGDDIKETNIIPDDNHYEQSVNMNKTDPLLALQAFDDASKQKDDAILWDNSKGSVESNYQYHMDAALDVSAKKNQDMSYQSTFDEPFVDNHLAMGPVMRGLKTTLSHKDNSAEMQYIAEEIGASLREAIQGLLKIQQQVTAQHFSTISKNFQPIIDNPLRMGLSYDETVELMYDDDISLVHLSAPAAIKESLDTLFNHQEAMHYAITEALDQILVAFSPEALMHRFQYYRTARRLSAEEQNSWAWKMYQAYYSELISNRQTGFKKLFWEIFDQVYDKKMRELQMNIGVDKHD
ncbi:MAG: type VI secretion system-associated FHA domain protein TagH, partial [Wohlfahrtiimonas sp.]